MVAGPKGRLSEYPQPAMPGLVSPKFSTWMNGLAERDRFGDRIHLALALTMLFTIPLNSAVGGVLFGALCFSLVPGCARWFPCVFGVSWCCAVF